MLCPRRARGASARPVDSAPVALSRLPCDTACMGKRIQVSTRSRRKPLPEPEQVPARRVARKLRGQPVAAARQTARAQGYLFVLRWCDGACPESGTGRPDEIQAAARGGQVVDAWAADDPRAQSSTR